MRAEVGDKLQAKQDIGYIMGQAPEDKIEEDEVVTVDKLVVWVGRTDKGETPRETRSVQVAEHADRYGPFPLEYFRRVGPVMCPKCGSIELDELGKGPDGDGYGCEECQIMFLLQHYNPEF